MCPVLCHPTHGDDAHSLLSAKDHHFAILWQFIGRHAVESSVACFKNSVAYTSYGNIQ